MSSIRLRPVPQAAQRLAVAALLLVGACEPGSRTDPGREEPEEDPAVAALSGPELAQRYCTGCHVLPDPAALDKETWREWVLPAMGHRFGIYERPGVREDSLLEPGIAGQLVRQANVFPERPALAPATWQRLVEYYLSHAPEALPPQPAREVRPRLPGFQVRIPAFRLAPPLTTLVQVDEASRLLYLGDTKQDFSTLEVLEPGAREPVQSVGLESAPTHLRLVGDSAYALLAGKLLPTDEPSGLLRKLYRRPGGSQFVGAVRLIDALHRPVHASYADLNGDGLEDVVISEFGFRIGRLAWYEATGGDDYRPHVLKPLPGAVRTEVRDVDGDGDPDILALMAQGDEGLFLFRNQGGGQFTEERLLTFPPSYGSTGFELHDFNRDGHFDILYVNGDNGDYDPIAKPYHGVRVFLNDGANRFAEAAFFPLYGAFGVTARDFDADGDLDIAAIAFYPEYRDPPAEGFVYLQNRGDLSFAASTFPEVNRGRWITLDAGDLDGDGDDDLVLGSFVAFDPTGDTTGLQQRWLEEGPSFVVLENRRR